MQEVKNLNELILSGNFEMANKIVSKLSLEVVTKKLLSLSYKEASPIYYSFVLYLIKEDECADNHSIAAQLLSTSLCHLKDAYKYAYWHALRAVEMEPLNVQHKEFLLFFHENPENILFSEKAIETANDIFTGDSEIL